MNKGIENILFDAFMVLWIVKFRSSKHFFVSEFTQDIGSGLLHAKLLEPVKLEVCRLLQHLAELELRHRVEALASFSTVLVAKVQQVRFDCYFCKYLF